jgi:hypothetical protein
MNYTHIRILFIEVILPCRLEKNDFEAAGEKLRAEKLTRSGGTCPEIDATSDCCRKHQFGIRRALLMLSQAEK